MQIPVRIRIHLQIHIHAPILHTFSHARTYAPTFAYAYACAQTPSAGGKTSAGKQMHMFEYACMYTYTYACIQPCRSCACCWDEGWASRALAFVAKSRDQIVMSSCLQQLLLQWGVAVAFLLSFYRSTCNIQLFSKEGSGSQR